MDQHAWPDSRVRGQWHWVLQQLSVNNLFIYLVSHKVNFDQPTYMHVDKMMDYFCLTIMDDCQCPVIISSSVYTKWQKATLWNKYW